MQNGVHDRPLGRTQPPTALGFLAREFDDMGAAYVSVENPVHDKHTAPDDFTGFANAFECATAEAEVHGRLAFAARTAITADEMRSGGCARDEENPDVSIDAVAAVM